MNYTRLEAGCILLGSSVADPTKLSVTQIDVDLSRDGVKQIEEISYYPQISRPCTFNLLTF